MGEELGETEKMRRWVTMLVTTGLLVALKKDAVGFVAGLFCRWSYEMPVMLNRTKGGRGFLELRSRGESGLRAKPST